MNRRSSIDRRHFLGLLAAAGASPLAAGAARAAGLETADLRGSINAAELGVRPGAFDDQSITLQNALNRAAELGRTLFLEPGNYYVSNILMPRRGRLAGISGETRLIYSGAGHLIVAERADLVQLTDLVLDGANRPLGSYAPGIVHLIDVPDIHIAGCRMVGSQASAIVADRCTGRIAGNDISGAAIAGIAATESTGLSITDNTVAACGNNGITIVRWRDGDDGTLVFGNRIEGIRAGAGDTGPNGNAIKLFQAHGAIVAQNRITDCAFSAIRADATDNLEIIGNNCAGLGDAAIHCGIGFDGAVIADNVVDDAADGIVVANPAGGGRLASVAGNVLRNLNRAGAYASEGAGFGIGIHVDADGAVTGNLVASAARAGIWLGWGPADQEIVASTNIVRNAPIGIAVSALTGTGTMMVRDNLISGTDDNAAIVGMRWNDRATGDLARAGGNTFPWLALRENIVTG